MVLSAFSLEDIGIQGTFTIPQIPSIDYAALSLYDEKNHALVTSQRQLRAPFRFEKLIDHGSYGNVYLAKRGEIHVLVKQPRMEEMNLLQEAVLQHLAYKTLEWAIPKVYDVFRKGQEICFSMEYIHGVSIPEWYQRTSSADTDTFFLLAQICLILGALETHLNLDHRDLKSSNLLIKPESCLIRLKLKDATWTLQSPFTLIVLDFGFACLGSEMLRGKPLVNLGDGILPPMDPCPKEGRDMFHLLTSLLGLPIFREKISPRLHDKIDAWLSIGQKSYGPMARRWSTENWSYLVSSQPHFSIPSCCPFILLPQLIPELRPHLTLT